MNALHQDQCLDSTQLQAVLSPDHTSADLELHLAQCESCQKRLDSLTDSLYLRSFSKDLWNPYPFLDPPIRALDMGTVAGIAIEHVVSQGGMGVVFAGYDISLDRRVAVKVLLTQHGEDDYARFESEVRALAKLSHPSIVSVFSVGKTRDFRPYMVMQFVEGASLHQMLTTSLPEPGTAARWIEQVATALETAHQTGMIHRDVKPANILIDRIDNTAKLIDFGLVRDSSIPSITKANVLCGTPEYMAPEQISTTNTAANQGQVDVYGLGITLYEALTGTVPFRGQAMEILEQHRSADPVPPRDLNRTIPKDLETICLTAMAKDPSRRYASAKAMADDLQRYLAGQPIAARPASQFERTWRWIQRNPQLSAALLLFMASLVLGSVATTYMWQQRNANAIVAQRLATKLEESRQRMRQSVEKFQSRVFSKESLHWQMTTEFRSEMFRDVIDFLDEFHSFPSMAKSEDQESLAASYLAVAQFASDVGQYREAQVASQRSLAITQNVPMASKSASLLMNESQCCLVALIADQALQAFQPESAKTLVDKCLAASQRALKLAPDNWNFKRGATRPKWSCVCSVLASMRSWITENRERWHRSLHVQRSRRSLPTSNCF